MLCLPGLLILKKCSLVRGCEKFDPKKLGSAAGTQKNSSKNKSKNMFDPRGGPGLSGLHHRHYSFIAVVVVVVVVLVLVVLMACAQRRTGEIKKKKVQVRHAALQLSLAHKR